MKKQLINEAKRLQELAGIKKLNENTSPGSEVVWVFGSPGNPNEDVKVLDGDNLIEEITKGELWDQDPGFRASDYSFSANQNKEGTWDVDINDGEFTYRGLKKGEDFELVPENKLQPLIEAYNNPTFEKLLPNSYYEFPAFYYLVYNNYELETGTEEWMDLVDIIGEENMSEYIDFLENTLKINVI